MGHKMHKNGHDCHDEDGEDDYDDDNDHHHHYHHLHQISGRVFLCLYFKLNRSTMEMASEASNQWDLLDVQISME